MAKIVAMEVGDGSQTVRTPFRTITFSIPSQTNSFFSVLHYVVRVSLTPHSHFRYKIG